jgi:hypothetical protein
VGAKPIGDGASAAFGSSRLAAKGIALSWRPPPSHAAFEEASELDRALDAGLSGAARAEARPTVCGPTRRPLPSPITASIRRVVKRRIGAEQRRQ